MAALFPENNLVETKWGGGDRLVVAEAPGKEEAAAGEPLVGKSGMVFNSLMAKAGVRREGLTLANTLSCRPPDNVYPLASDARSYITKPEAEKAVAQCYEKHLKPVLDGRQWARIDVFGDRALEAVCGKKGIYSWRGMPLARKDGDGTINVVPTIHPAALMRDQTMYPVVVSDLKKSLVQPPETYNTHPSLEDVRAFNATEFAYDIETNRYTNEILMVGLSAAKFTAICVPFRGPYLPELKRIFGTAKLVVGQNCIQFDQPLLERNGIVFAEGVEVADIMLMHHLVSPDMPHDLEFIASVYTNKPAWKHLVGQDKELYCCRDTDITLQIYPQLKALLKQFGLASLYQDVSVPMALICKLMRETGFKIDPGRIKEVRERLKATSKTLEDKLPESLRTQLVPVNRRILAPKGFRSPKTGKPVKYTLVPSSEEVVPWRSPTATAKWLYEELKLPVQRDVNSGNISTGKIALDKLARTAPADSKAAIQAVRKLRQIDETLTTFAKEKMSLGSAVYAHFNVHGTSSGRLSSSDPNLQNIPEEARCIYIPHNANWKIVQVDYSQIENRLTAHLAGDTERLERFLKDPGFSEHRFAASVFFNEAYENVVKDNDKEAPYGKAKRIVHGTNYGMGPRKIANLYDMQEAEVRKLQKAWKDAISKTSNWQEATAAQAKADGYLANPFGRRRWFYTSSYYTESLSFIPQSAAADVILRAMVALLYERVGLSLDRVLRVVQVAKPLPRPANLLASVHDSLVFECPAYQVDELVKVIKLVMEQPWRELGGFSCPISIEVGDDWGPAEKGGSLVKYAN